MLNEQTQQKLIDMRLRGMATAFEELLEQRGRDKLSFEERFGHFVDREWSERQERRLRRRLGQAKLRETACIEDINYRHPRKLDRSVVQRLAASQWVGSHENIIVTGPTGIGKSWLACALADKACRDGFTVVYKRVPRLLHELHIARADGSYVRELVKLQKARVLILDDLGLAPLTETQRHDLLEIVEDRHGRGSAIVTSQLPVAKWHDNVGDPTVADAILDRLVHTAHRLELDGPSMRAPRKKTAKKK